MGEVYLAEDMRLSRKVAIKLLPAQSLGDELARKRFLKEAQAAARLDHPNICAIHEVGEEDDVSFIVMQYVEGDTLASRIRQGPLEVGQALDIAVQVAAAVACEEAQGVVHRDIKPQNIMISPNGQAKVLDFGLARTLSSEQHPDSKTRTESLLTEPGRIIGSVPYMSPEQIRDEPLDIRSDIFAFGVVLFEMLSGQHPFVAKNPAATISAILTQEPPPLTHYSTEVPAELERIVARSLRKDREERYQTARDLLVDLKKLKEDLEFATRLERSLLPAVGPSPARTTQLRTARTRAFLIGGIGHNKIALAVFALAALALVGVGLYLYAGRGGGDKKRINSIAVLPFANASGNSDLEYLGDGITESVINSLSQLPALRVTARPTVFAYKGREVDPRAVGRELKADAVLMGKVDAHGGLLVVQADLINVADGSQVWGDQYKDRRAADIFAIQEDISKEIAGELRLKLTGEEQQRLTRRHTGNTEAFELYVKGRRFWDSRTEEGVKEAVEHFRRALEKDPNYAPAYAGLADAYLVLGDYGYMQPKEAYPQAKEAALRALEIDESLAEAHAALAFVRLYYDWDWPNAEREFKRAIELKPSYATAHHWYGNALVTTGRPDEGIVYLKNARELDPLSLIIKVAVGWKFYLTRDYDRAIEEYQNVLETEPAFAPAYSSLGWAYEHKGVYEKAVAEFQKVIDLRGESPVRLAHVGRVYAAWGRPDEAQKVLRKLKTQLPRGYVPPYYMAAFYAALGDRERAFQELEKAYAERSSLLVYLNVDPAFDRLREDPRFMTLRQRVGLAF